MKFRNLSILVLLAALIFSFAACGSDDDEDNPIVGVWQYSGNQDLSAEAITNKDSISAAIEKQIIVNYNDDAVYTIEFKSDGTFIDNGNNTEGTYNVKIGIITTNVIINGKTEFTASPYKIRGNKLTISEDCTSDYTDVNGKVDPNSEDVKNLFIDYAEELGKLTVKNFTSISRAEVLTSYTRQ